MSATVCDEIFVPCAPFTVQARLGTRDGPGVVETALLRAIHAGVEHSTELAALFGLPDALIVDALYDLWTAGHVVLDPRRGIVRLTSQASEVVATGDLTSIEGAARTIQSVSLMQELLTGAILPLGGRRNPGRDTRTAPARFASLDPRLYTPQDLADAVVRAAQKHADPDGPVPVVREVWPDATPGEPASGGLRWLPLTVECRRERHGDRLQFTIVDPGGLAPSVCRAIEEGLATGAEAAPDAFFYKGFRDSAAPLAPVGRLGAALASLDKTLRGLDAVDPGVVTQRHAALENALALAERALVEYRGSPTRARVLCGRAAHEDAVRAVFGEAKHQVALVCPFVSPQAMDARGPGDSPSFWTLIESALARGVSVFVIWGIGADEPLDGQLELRRNTLRRAHPGRFFMARRSGRAHAKLVIRDADQAIVSSFNFLDPSSAQTFELGVVLEADGDTVACGLAEQALSVVRDLFPDYDDSRVIRTFAEEFHRIVDRDLDDPSPGPVEVPQELLADSGLRAPAIRMWAESWRIAHASVMARAQGGTRTARLVRDGEHRVLLEEALRDVRDRLVIMSDRLGADVLTTWFLEALEMACSRGVNVTLIWRRCDERVLDPAQAPDLRLRQLAERYPATVRVVSPGAGAHAGNHAKVLIADRTAIVSSFNFLSVTGEYGTGPVGVTRRQRAEVGVLVHDAPVVEAIVAAIVARFGEGVVSTVAAVAQTSALPVPATSMSILSVLAHTTRTDADDLEAWIASAGDPWDDLNRARDSGVAEDRIEVAVAAVLAHNASAPAALPWRGWLGLRYWARGSVFPAVLLWGDLQRADLPSERLRRVACAPGAIEAFAAVFDEVACEEGPLDEADGATAVLIPLLVVDGWTGAAEPLAMVMGRASPPLRTWAACALSWWETGHGAVLHMPAVRARVDRGSAEREAARLRGVLREALTEAASVGFRFPLGQHTWDDLRRPEGMLGALSAFCDAGDVAGLRRWLGLCRAAESDCETLMDEATARVTRVAGDLITAPKRGVCLARLRDAWKAAEAWESAVPADDKATAWAVGEAKRLGEFWSPGREAVVRVQAESGLAGPLMVRLLNLANSLVALGTSS